MNDGDLLDHLLFGVDENGERYDLPPATREAFTDWKSKGLAERDALTPKQRAWLRGVGERRGVIGPEAQNLFSALSPARQAEQRARAAKVKLPWEK